jgi:hypothetical protein
LILKKKVRKKYSENFAVFLRNTANFCKNLIKEIEEIEEKRQNFRRKWSKIAENWDRNIDPRYTTISNINTESCTTLLSRT